MKPPYRVGYNVYRILPEHSMNRFQHSSLWCCHNERYDCQVHESYEGNRPCFAAVLDIRLSESCLLDERMHMKGITEGDQCIEDYHIVTVSGKSEREQHEGIYRNAVW